MRRRGGMVLLAAALAAGCKNPDDGPIPYVMPAYPVRNMPPLQPRGTPPQDSAPSVKAPLPVAPAGSTQRGLAPRTAPPPAQSHSALDLKAR
jgi:hypothetical protein